MLSGALPRVFVRSGIEDRFAIAGAEVESLTGVFARVFLLGNSRTLIDVNSANRINSHNRKLFLRSLERRGVIAGRSIVPGAPWI